MQSPLATTKLTRVMELHFATAREGSTDSNFVVIPPKKEGRMESVEFSDVKLIRRTIYVTNQMCPREVIQAADQETGIPPFEYSDPNNASGVGIPVQMLKSKCS